MRVETEKLPMAAALKGPVHATARGGTTPSPGRTGANVKPDGAEGTLVRDVGNVQSEGTEKTFT